MEHASPALKSARIILAILGIISFASCLHAEDAPGRDPLSPTSKPTHVPMPKPQPPNPSADRKVHVSVQASRPARLVRSPNRSHYPIASARAVYHQGQWRTAPIAARIYTLPLQHDYDPSAAARIETIGGPAIPFLYIPADRGPSNHNPD